MRMEPGEMTTVNFGDSVTATEASGILELGTRLKAGLRQKRLLMHFKERCTVSFTYEIVEL